MKSTSEPAFTVVDKRGQPREEEHEVRIITPEPEPTGDKTIWKGKLAFIVVLNQTPTGPMVIGRAVGQRGDGNVFTADYAFCPLWPEGFDWTKTARERL